MIIICSTTRYQPLGAATIQSLDRLVSQLYGLRVKVWVGKIRVDSDIFKSSQDLKPNASFFSDIISSSCTSKTET
ncbi:uncharacterized protein BKA55DRAFT_568456 [Fusarium redolens]|uniref:Uncharacterized protein n=1 Tax=Fusarium redolens TaxID=48865 RepID=A0A9P9H401_FUSRE|nr:uncharacterized protein BKA55DRAFT_568456 [Fusarium redolens]KAH7249965.1 hypothetical protein BKA55DRAFT_568456 [Fusarium redolens]